MLHRFSFPDISIFLTYVCIYVHMRIIMMTWIRQPWNRPTWIRPLWIHPPEKLHALRKRRERDRNVRVLNKGSDSRRRLADRERARARRGSETATQREVRLVMRRIADRSRRVSQSQSIEEREARLHQLRLKRAKLELTNDAAFKFWSYFSPIVGQISESHQVTIKTLYSSVKNLMRNTPQKK